MPIKIWLILLVCCILMTARCTSGKSGPVSGTGSNGGGGTSGPAAGPLQVDARNPRYFNDSNGNIVYLTGSHTWFDLQDAGTTDPPPAFDFQQWLNFLQSRNHNFFRLWVWEQANWMLAASQDIFIAPHPFQRTGPGMALDGKPKFDLTRFDQAYFDRMRQRVIDAGQRGIYVSIMLFNGFSVEKSKGQSGLQNPWKGHPFNRNNNVNGIDGDPNNNDSGEETHTLQIPAITTVQENYVRKVVDTVNDLNNVLYEISNESHSGSTAWQYHMIGLVKSYELGKPKKHPVGMTVEYPGGTNAELFASPADWISPNAGSENYYDDPQPADGRKVLLLDTDHLCGICGDRNWVWKSFLRGGNPVFMDTYNSPPPGTTYDVNNPNDVSLRANMGYASAFARRISLAAMTPRSGLSSSGYCLANPSVAGAEYLVYIPTGGIVTVDLSGTSDTMSVEWLDPKSGNAYGAASVQGGAVRSFTPPFSGDAVLYIHGPKGTSPQAAPLKPRSS